ncbi:hypothetical protein C2G38_2040335 [Gigaspora rosea]|uniref:Uncharacterized protein n=1 Tax=Gigaspora rosea TaxID=44941 RepID=A0A397UXE8_9GLOM|nr:hypothetical protein C2G38_2040335 [Gigaspora rosea]
MRNQKLVLMLDQSWVSSKSKTFFPASLHVPRQKLKEKMVLSIKQEKQKTNTYYSEIPSSFQTQNAVPGFNSRFPANLKRELVRRKAKQHKEKQPKMRNQKLGDPKFLPDPKCRSWFQFTFSGEPKERVSKKKSKKTQRKTTKNEKPETGTYVRPVLGFFQVQIILPGVNLRFPASIHILRRKLKEKVKAKRESISNEKKKELNIEVKKLVTSNYQ